MHPEQPQQALRVLALEAWMGGSHAAFLRAWKRESIHRIEVEGLAARHWKWRMSASAWELGRRIASDAEPPDVLFATDYVDLSQLPAFLPPSWSAVPRVLYMHENQLTYPVQEDVPADTSWGFKNILACVAADQVVFNSEFHRREFASAADGLLRTLPRPTPRAELTEVLGRAMAVGPGIERDRIPLGTGAPANAPLRVLFNHRWEHDKNPSGFLESIAALRKSGLAVEVVALGQGFSRVDRHTADLLEELSDCVQHRGFIDDETAYFEAIGSCDVVVSTALHEFYGISILEAICAGCTALVPDRLAYPETLPPDVRQLSLYGDDADLVRKLGEYARDPDRIRRPECRRAARSATRPHGVDRSAVALDRIVSEVAARRT